MKARQKNPASGWILSIESAKGATKLKHVVVVNVVVAQVPPKLTFVHVFKWPEVACNTHQRVH